jgi:dsDNA-specific endonuclease/ATPase MutS2
MINSEEPVKIPITGVLDLHDFNPREVKELVLEYLDQCQLKGVYEGRIIHGKGMGTLREIVQSTLRKYPQIKNFHSSDLNAGGWGATSFSLIPSEHLSR